MAISIPRYVERFRDALLAGRPRAVELQLGRWTILGQRGILTTSKIQYNQDPSINVLGRELEYTFRWDDEQIEISMQLYRTYRGHWRLFC